jgi:hypothetical protein
MDDLLDTLPSECLFAESPLDIIEHFSMCRICLIQDVSELKIRGTQAVAEVLGENPSAI